eukprot:5903449-Amphidinium_carterae.1
MGAGFGYDCRWLSSLLCQNFRISVPTGLFARRNWKFEKFMSLKIHTEDVGPVQATTADNVVLQTTATVNWCIKDTSIEITPIPQSHRST